MMLVVAIVGWFFFNLFGNYENLNHLDIVLLSTRLTQFGI